MADTLALEDLYTKALATFAVDGTFGVTPTPEAAARTANPFGWREPARQGGPVARIVWTPGDLSGALGEVLGPRYPGRLPARPLGDLGELFTCRIQAADVSDINDELLQWKAARLLFDAWFRACYLAAHGNFSIVSARWAEQHNERRFGATIEVVGAILSTIPDENQAATNVAVDGAFDVHDLNQSETIEIP